MEGTSSNSETNNSAEFSEGGWFILGANQEHVGVPRLASIHCPVHEMCNNADISLTYRC